MRFESVSLSGFAKRTLNGNSLAERQKERGTRCTLTTAQEVIQYEGQLQYGVMARLTEKEVNQYYFKVTNNWSQDQATKKSS